MDCLKPKPKQTYNISLNDQLFHFDTESDRDAALELCWLSQKHGYENIKQLIVDEKGRYRGKYEKYGISAAGLVTILNQEINKCIEGMYRCAKRQIKK